MRKRHCPTTDIIPWSRGPKYGQGAIHSASPAGDDPKALDAAARSSSTEAVEQEVERLRCGLEGAREAIAVAMADLSAKGWHHSERPCQTLTDASIAIRKLLARPFPVPAACKPEGETHG